MSERESIADIVRKMRLKMIYKTTCIGWCKTSSAVIIRQHAVGEGN